MSDLDDKLDGLWLKTEGERFHDRQEFMAEARQIFIDAGWEAPVEYDKPPKQLFGEPIPLGQTQQIIEFPINLMTGQKAFERLEKAGLLGRDLEIARDALCG